MVKNRIINGQGTVFLDDEVTHFTGQDLSRLILDFKSNGIEPIVNINSIGGSVFAGYQIIDSMLQVQANSHISGLAASIAAIIALHGSYRTANDYSVMMLHQASGKNSELNALVNASLRKILEKSSLPIEKINAIFDEGKDLFFDSSEMLQYGLIDKIVETDRKKKVDYTQTNCKEMWEVFNSIINNNQNMDLVKNKLNLSASATEQDVLNKIAIIESEKSTLEALAKESANEVNALKTENSELKNKLQELEESNAEAEKVAANAFAEALVSAKKIVKEDIQNWTDLYISNKEMAEKLAKGLTEQHSHQVIEGAVNNSGGSSVDFLSAENKDKLIEFMRSDASVKLYSENKEKWEKYNEAYINAIK